MTLITLLVFLLVLSFVVIVHELGHFLTARFFKIRVHEFGIGFPPKIIKLGRWLDTNFVLNWLPLGGYVSLDGQDGPVTDVNEDQTTLKPGIQDKFYQKKPWQRFLVLFAGPAMNFILAIIIFIIVFGIMGIPKEFDQAVFIDYVVENSPAQAANLQINTQVISFRDSAGTVYQISDRDQLVTLIGLNQGHNVTLVTTGECIAGQCQEIAQAFPVYIRTDEEKLAGEGALGVALTQSQMVFYPWYKQIPLSIYYGVKQSLIMSWEMLSGLGQAVASIFTGAKNDLVLMGPVGIVSQLDQQNTFESGFLAILQFTGLLSLNLGVINLLPLPALDGGRIVLLALEKIMGRQKIVKVEKSLNIFGFLFLIGMAIIITGQDIWRIFKGG